MPLRHITTRVQNARIAVSAELHHFGSSPVPFLCECDDENCNEVLGLTLVEYHWHREEGGYLLSPGHTIRDEPERQLAGG